MDLLQGACWPPHVVFEDEWVVPIHWNLRLGALVALVGTSTGKVTFRCRDERHVPYTHVYLYLYIYIYICKEIEREREIV